MKPRYFVAGTDLWDITLVVKFELGKLFAVTILGIKDGFKPLLSFNEDAINHHVENGSWREIPESEAVLIIGYL